MQGRNWIFFKNEDFKIFTSTKPERKKLGCISREMFRQPHTYPIIYVYLILCDTVGGEGCHNNHILLVAEDV